MGHIPNIDAVSSALFTLRIQYEYTQTHYDEGARDYNDIWYMEIIKKSAEMVEFQNLIEARFKRQFNRDIFPFLKIRLFQSKKSQISNPGK